jgi:hypothetical protein
MKNFRIIILCCFSLIISSSQAWSQDTVILDKILAKIGGEVIFLSDVEEQVGWRS